MCQLSATNDKGLVLIGSMFKRDKTAMNHTFAFHLKSAVQPHTSEIITPSSLQPVHCANWILQQANYSVFTIIQPSSMHVHRC